MMKSLVKLHAEDGCCFEERAPAARSIHFTQTAAFVARLQTGRTFISKKKVSRSVAMICLLQRSICFYDCSRKNHSADKYFFFPCDLNRYILVEATLGKENLVSGFVNIWFKYVASDFSQSSAVLLLSNCGSKHSANRGIPLLNDPGKSGMCSFAITQKCFLPLKIY